MDLKQNQLSGTISSFDSFPNTTISLEYNQFTFAGMERPVGINRFFKYGGQADIPVRQNGNLLSVAAGGTLVNDTLIIPAGRFSNIPVDSNA